jgi:hypothetical protein
MKTIFTHSILCSVVAKTNIHIKRTFLFVLTLMFICCYTISGYAQTVNTKSDKPIFTQNKFHYIPRPWFTRGNSGTDPSINFIGTRDAQPLVFKVNNQKAGYLDFSDTIQNTAFGYHALNSNIVSEADYSTFLSAFGWGALTSNTTGWGNTAHGAGSLYSNTTGDINNGLGVFSLISNTTGAFNTAIGSFSLSGNTTGSFNIATGDYALAGNTTGQANIANGGAFTLVSNTEGSLNIATGVFALTSNTTGNANIAYGNYSLASNVTGNNNTAIGDHADVAADDLTNATAIGNGALADASNKVRVGNADVTSIGGQVGWTSFSDERIKDNIKENVPGLEFIKALRPVTYHFNVAKENTLLGVKPNVAKNISLPQLKGIKMPGGKNFAMPSLTMPGTKNNAAKENNEIEKMQFTGFVAQEVDKAAKNIGYDFSGIDKSGKIMGLRYSDFVVPLVKAVQQLSEQNEELQKQNNNLEERITKLEATMNMQQSTTNNQEQTKNLYSASLDQNKPNPFTKTTTIAYTLPQKFADAQIIITDKNGKTLKQINISGSGKGTVNVDAATLTSGAYNYSLYENGKLISSKQMVLTK